MTAINPAIFATTDPLALGHVAVTTQGTTKRVMAVCDQTGEIAAIIPARFVDPTPPFPSFRRLTVRLMPSGKEAAYLHHPEGTDERTYVSLDQVKWSQDAALFPNADPT